MSGVPPRTTKSKVFRVDAGAQEAPLDVGFAHNYVCAYVCDANGDPLASYTGLSGKFDLEVLSQNCPVYQKPQNANIKANEPTDASIEGNLLSVKIVPDNIVGGTYFRIHTSQNLT